MKKPSAQQGPTWADEYETARQGGYLWMLWLLAVIALAGAMMLLARVCGWLP